MMIFRSPYPRVAIPEVPLPVFALRCASHLRHKPALIEGPTGRALTYGGLADGAHRVAFALARRGLRKGDTVAIYSINLPEYACAFYARWPWAPPSRRSIPSTPPMK